jgi:hypothetical protein
VEAKRRKTELSIAIPASLVSDTPHLREKTSIVGLVGRAAAIFRASNVIIYGDAEAGESEASFIRLILNYMDTPQYLRKRLFPLKPELQYTGVLHPLRTPHHPTRNRLEDLRIGEFREGVVLAVEGENAEVEIGVAEPLLAEGRAASPGSRVTVKVVETRPQLRGRLARQAEIEEYWGYRVQTSPSLGDVISRRRFDLSIATSRLGRPLLEVINPIRERWVPAKRVLIAFGSPKMGLAEILRREGLELERCFDFVVNTIPHQGCETVRTEEAIYCTLSAFNLLMEN